MTQNVLNDLIEVRNIEVDGVSDWVWLKGEKGAWEGPSREFRELREKIIPHCKGQHLIIQAGGCLGMYPRLWSKHFQYVYTFEPDTLNFYFLSRNCVADNIFKFNCALGDTHDPVMVQRSGMENVGMHRVMHGGAVPQLKIDDFDPPHLNAIQLDVESCEMKVLKGARRLIEKFHPVISIESSGDDHRNFLKEYDYHVVGQVAADTIWAVK